MANNQQNNQQFNLLPNVKRTEAIVLKGFILMQTFEKEDIYHVYLVCKT